MISERKALMTSLSSFYMSCAFVSVWVNPALHNYILSYVPTICVCLPSILPQSQTSPRHVTIIRTRVLPDLNKTIESFITSYPNDTFLEASYFSWYRSGRDRLWFSMLFTALPTVATLVQDKLEKYV